jgi:hypothetical protein
MGLFVARLSRLAEEAKGWQAFFSVFLKVFERVRNRGLRGYAQLIFLFNHGLHGYHGWEIF